MTINTPDITSSKTYLNPRGAGQDKNIRLCVVSYSQIKTGWVKENWGLRSYWNHELSQMTTYTLDEFPLLFQMQYKVLITICWNPKKTCAVVNKDVSHGKLWIRGTSGFTPGVILPSRSEKCLAKKVQIFGKCILWSIMPLGPKDFQ